MQHLPHAIIYDMDGTLVDVSGIRHYVLQRERNFDAFHTESVDCPPNRWVVASARDNHMKGYKILIVTARSAKYRHHTAWWLALNGVPSDALYMRANGDNRPDAYVKEDILKKIRSQYNVREAYDDNPVIISVWLREGIPVIGVPGWKYGQ